MLPGTQPTEKRWNATCSLSEQGQQASVVQSVLLNFITEASRKTTVVVRRQFHRRLLSILRTSSFLKRHPKSAPTAFPARCLILVLCVGSFPTLNRKTRLCFLLSPQTPSFTRRTGAASSSPSLRLSCATVEITLFRSTSSSGGW